MISICKQRYARCKRKESPAQAAQAVCVKKRAQMLELSGVNAAQSAKNGLLPAGAWGGSP